MTQMNTDSEQKGAKGTKRAQGPRRAESGALGCEVEPPVYVPPEEVKGRGVHVAEQLNRGVKDRPRGFQRREFGLEQAGRTNAKGVDYE